MICIRTIFQSLELSTNAYFGNFLEFTDPTRKALKFFIFSANYQPIFIKPRSIIPIEINMQLFLTVNLDICSILIR